MKTLIAAAICLLAVPAAAQTIDPAAAVVGRNHQSSTARFADACEKQVAWCDGYLAGATAVSTQPMLCMKPGMTGTEFRPLFLAWYKKNPQSADLAAPFSVLRFGIETFPCTFPPRT